MLLLLFFLLVVVGDGVALFVVDVINDVCC
jgi:hypothetical protein